MEWAKLLFDFERRTAIAASVPSPQTTIDPEEDIDKAVTETKKNVLIFTSKVDSVEEEMLKLFTDNPEPSSQDADDMVALLAKLNEFKDNLHTYSVKLGLEGANYFDQNKAKETSEAAKNDWKTKKAQIDCLQRKGKEYLSKAQPSVPPPNHQSRARNIPLERLPLPTFKGNKIDYLRFKQDFKNHVKYESEGEKMLALKTKCLVKYPDKQRVSNMMTLQECWDKLDEEYGDIDTLVAEVFSTWENLKPPTNDPQFIKFVESIENGVSLLKSLGHEKEMDSSYSAVMLEKKLPVRLQQEYSKSFSSDKGTAKDRMQFLLKFLKLEKQACHLRTSNYCGITKKKDDDENSVATNFGGVSDRGGGRGGRNRGRGRDNQDRNKGGDSQDKGRNGRGGGRGTGKHLKRGEPNTKCVVCQADHASSKCATWRDEKNTKTDLHYLASENIPKPFCLWCLEPGHFYNKCFSKEEYGCPCNSGINKFLCGNTDDCKTRKNWSKTSSSISTTDTISSSLTMVNGVSMGDALLPIQKIPLSNFEAELRVMFDNCSQSTFIRTKTAKKLKLKGVLIDYILICTDGSERKMRGFLYKLSLRDMSGELHELEAIGINKLSTAYAGVKVVNLKKVLNNVPTCRSLTEDKLERESGELDLLIGSDLAHLHPKSVADVGSLSIMKSKFSTGWTMMGHHKDHLILTGKEKGVKANVCAVKKIKVTDFFDTKITSNMAGTKDLQFLDAVSTESIGVNVAPKCSSCKAKTENCTECKLKAEMMTYLEFLQDQQINENIEKLPDKNQYVASYPYTKEIFNLLPNKEIAMKRAENLEANLLKHPNDLQQLNESLFDSFSRGVFRFISEEEIKKWTGQTHYIPMNCVYKESESTPVRLVFDSGQPDRNGRSLNGCMGKGKKPLNHFGSIVLNFRAAEQENVQPNSRQRPGSALPHILH